MANLTKPLAQHVAAHDSSARSQGSTPYDREVWLL
ncbi:hypothetical protein RS9916_40396 [Synechococcus sp. RS9916]|nr:hypothetical protein RS9916_40396 [Synechococcus sp. RS9916]